jgi:predicted enzyme related to lactoylglutathione lyase
MSRLSEIRRRDSGCALTLATRLKFNFLRHTAVLRENHSIPARPKLRFVGVQLYFDDLETAKQFYRDTLNLEISDEEIGRYAKFREGSNFICLERKGAESYASLDKAVLFFEVSDLSAVMDALGKDKIIRSEPEHPDRPAWAVIHDPEGHNILLLQGPKP